MVLGSFANRAAKFRFVAGFLGVSLWYRSSSCKHDGQVTTSQVFMVILPNANTSFSRRCSVTKSPHFVHGAALCWSSARLNQKSLYKRPNTRSKPPTDLDDIMGFSFNRYNCKMRANVMFVQVVNSWDALS